ncbi:hypothetical protein DM01DRAFT_328947, partial [Hesseltinella vesiculosa]
MSTANLIAKNIYDQATDVVLGDHPNVDHTHRVSTAGQVVSKSRNQERYKLLQCISRGGHPTDSVQISTFPHAGGKRNVTVKTANIMVDTFLGGRKPFHVLSFVDGNPLNVHLDNLVYQHSYLHYFGTMTPGELDNPVPFYLVPGYFVNMRCQVFNTNLESVGIINHRGADAEPRFQLS